MKQIVKFRGIKYTNYGDVVYCPNCKVTEVVPVGASICPKCGEEVIWAEDDLYEVEMANLNTMYEVVEEDAKLTHESLFVD